MAICRQGRWSPDPGNLICAQNDCGDPQPANGVVIGNYCFTLSRSNVTFQCAAGLAPTGVETAVCGNDGRWTPDSTNHGCGNTSTGVYHMPTCIVCTILMFCYFVVNCSALFPPAGGSIDPYTSTVQGAKVTFQCDEEFSPSGPMTVVCQADGNWEPDPATIVYSTSGIILIHGM